VRSFVIGHEPLKPPDGHRLELFAENTDLLALVLLRANAPAYRRKSVLLFDFSYGAEKIALPHKGDKSGDVNFDGAAGNARRILALDAPLGFPHGMLFRIAQGHFVEVPRSVLRVLARHWLFVLLPIFHVPTFL
jgi:hypothetical protein